MQFQGLQNYFKKKNALFDFGISVLLKFITEFAHICPQLTAVSPSKLTNIFPFFVNI